MSNKEEGELKEPSGTAGYGSPCHGDRNLRDANSLSHTGDRPDRSQDDPEGSETT